MPPLQTPHTPTPTITIRAEPTHSPNTKSLAAALEAEVAELYPDAALFPWRGGGDWLRGVPEEQDVVQGNDGEEGDGGEGRLWVFVAVAEGDLGESGVGVEVRDVGNGNGNWNGFCNGAGSSEVVACVGVRVLPWFPLHRAPRGARGKGVEVQVGGGVADGGREGEEGTEGEKEPRTAEVKRMYVVPDWRGRRVESVSSESGSRAGAGAGAGQSVAAHLLRYAEEFAEQELKAKRLVLETGMRQIAAMRLYQRAGWARREDFGDYVGAGEDVGGLSRCWEKWLVDS